MTKVLPPSLSPHFPSSIPPSSLHLSFERGITLDLIRVIPYLPSGKEAETIYMSGCHDAHYLRQEDLKYGSSWLIKSLLSFLTHTGKEGHRTLLCPTFSSLKIGETWFYLFLFMRLSRLQNFRRFLCVCVLKSCLCTHKFSDDVKFLFAVLFYVWKSKTSGVNVPVPSTALNAHLRQLTHQNVTLRIMLALSLP